MAQTGFQTGLSDRFVSTQHAPAEVPVYAGKMSVGRKLRAYVALTKPRVIELLLVTTLPTMFFAYGGVPSVWLMVATMVGGGGGGGRPGGGDCYIDRDMDRLMRRTEKRPLVTGEVSPREALVFGWALGIVSIALLWFGANPLTGLLGLGAILLYVVFYTLILKRRTTQNIVWGGIAGCMPVLIAWAAVTNTVEWPAVILFTVIFLWTPPHYWPLSMKYGEDYRNASVPMLGAVAGAKLVSVQVVLYAYATVACSLLLIPVGGAGWVYTAGAVLSGIWFLAETHLLHSRALRGEVTDKSAMKVFHGSISYLTILFVALAIDPFVGGPLL